MKLRIGDVIRFERKEQVVIFVNDSRALIIPLTFAVTWKDMPTGYTHFMAEGKGESISPSVEQEDVIRHMTVEQMKQNFSGAAANPAGQLNTAVQVESSSNTMKKTNQTAATVAATTSNPPVPAKTGKKGRKAAAPATEAVAVPAAAPVAAATATPAATPAPRPSMKGTLIGRGKFVMDNAPKFDPAKPLELGEFIKLVNAAYPICNHPANWCVKQLKHARARIADRAARQVAAAEQAKLNEEAKKKATEAAAKAAADAAKAAAKPAAAPPAPAPTNGSDTSKKGGSKKGKGQKTVAA